MLNAGQIAGLAQMMRDMIGTDTSWLDYNAIVGMANATKLPGLPITTDLSCSGNHLQAFIEVPLDVDEDTFFQAYASYVQQVSSGLPVHPREFFAQDLKLSASDAAYLFPWSLQGKQQPSPRMQTVAAIPVAALAMWNYGGVEVVSTPADYVVWTTSGNIGIRNARLLSPLPDIINDGPKLLLGTLSSAWRGQRKSRHAQLGDKMHKHFCQTRPHLRGDPTFRMLCQIARHRMTDQVVRTFLKQVCFPGVREKKAAYAVKD